MFREKQYNMAKHLLYRYFIIFEGDMHWSVPKENDSKI